METKIKPLSVQPLSAEETNNLLLLLTPLRKFLGSPGDWGYGTKLADLTIDVARICTKLENPEIII